MIKVDKCPFKLSDTIGNAYIQLDQTNLDVSNQERLHTQATDFDIISVQVIAKDGEILEQFRCSLQMLETQENSPNHHGDAIPQEIYGPTKGLTYVAPCEGQANFMEVEWENPILQNPGLLQMIGAHFGAEGIDRIMDMSQDPNQYVQWHHLTQTLGGHREHYAQFKVLKETLGAEVAIAQILAPKAIPETFLALGDHPQNTPPTTHPVQYPPLQPFFLASTLVYRLPALYGQTKYLMKELVGVDMDQQLEKIDTTFYTSYGVENFSNQVGAVLKPSLILGGASVAYATSSDPVVLMIAMSEPELGLGQDSSFLDMLYYTVSITTFIRTATMLSQSAVVGGLAVKCAAPLLALQGAHIASHIVVDGGFIAEDNQVLSFLQTTIGLITNSLGVAISPSMPLKVLHGFEVVTQGVALYQGVLDYVSENSERSSDFYSEEFSENDTDLMVAPMALIENDWL